jgi:hypothetical protein
MVDQRLVLGRVLAEALRDYLNHAPALQTTVLRSHLLCERGLNSLAELLLVRPEVLSVEQMGFASKARMLCALGLLEKSEMHGLLTLNRLRNRMAHEFLAQLTDDDRRQFVGSLPPSWTEGRPDASGSGFTTLLLWVGLQPLLILSHSNSRWQETATEPTASDVVDHVLDVLVALYGGEEDVRQAWRRVSEELAGGEAASS